MQLPFTAPTAKYNVLCVCDGIEGNDTLLGSSIFPRSSNRVKGTIVCGEWDAKLGGGGT